MTHRPTGLPDDWVAVGMLEWWGGGEESVSVEGGVGGCRGGRK